MCGIAGILYADSQRPVEPQLLSRMARCIAHRGPDGEGTWWDRNVGLGHRRLAIIDLAGGRQPITNEDGSVVAVFNGEIYNYQELRRDLESRGHIFTTRSDTEVLVHLYEERQERLVERLRGMFAFAIWDRRQRSLLLARDRIGLKPLYVYRDARKLVFASELKAILAHPEIDRALDVKSVEDYLTFGFIPGERSIFTRVQKLPAAHLLTATADCLDRPARRYWSLHFNADVRTSVDQWGEALRAKIAETVRLHTIADVPIGAFLSGGLDSSAIVATLAEQGLSNTKTFSIGFVEEEFSELPHAREIARQFGTEHSEQVVTAEAASSLDELVTIFDEPFADSSAIPTILLARAARQHVKVVLSGDGGDEAFGGYTRYPHDLREASIRRCVPSWMRQWIIRPMARYWPKADWLPRVLRAKTALTNLALDPGAAYANTISICRRQERRHLLHADIRAHLNGHRPERIVSCCFETVGDQDPLAGMLAADTQVLLADDFLTKIDRASMACGLEVRPPFVDHELIELAATIPSRWKINGGETKWILKQAYRDRLPPKILKRRKQGFEIPIDRWLRSPLAELFRQTVLSPASQIAALIDQQAAASLFRAHCHHTGCHGQLLWALLVLSCWTEKYLHTSRPTAAPDQPVAVGDD
jgi:asparagine synthase (glutamine-hydrolysing)